MVFKEVRLGISLSWNAKLRILAKTAKKRLPVNLKNFTWTALHKKSELNIYIVLGYKITHSPWYKICLIDKNRSRIYYFFGKPKKRAASLTVFLDQARTLTRGNELERACSTLKRIMEIMRMFLHQIGSRTASWRLKF